MTLKTELNRRKFLCLAGSVAATAVSPQIIAAPAVHTGRTASQEKQLSMLNLHTGERVDTTFWVAGRYLPDGLSDINKVLRDHRNNQVAKIDVELIDLLHRLHSKTGTSEEIQIISAYRSPETNAMLRKKSNGVAKRSLHMQGKAVDIRMSDISLDRLHKAALQLRGGGVGYYRKSNFIHLDVGRVRSWG
ncbi:DUF882 domain-containing protein [Marinobacterium jannaschii]|uniref:DUF882 domain-containing protein n=1 Tax=Marinobacterium jannaschii TaxID=64970 RepID=UPI0004824840|nr:DUF882 domain-containing protein [Marinobacterium jannaschii]